MSLSTYSDLQSAVADWLERSDLTARIPDFITLAEGQMNRELRVRKMLAVSTASIADEYSALPSDFLEEVSLTLTDVAGCIVDLDAAPQGALDRRWGYDGKTRYYAIVGDQVRYWPAPDATYTATLTYYQAIPALSEDNTSNWVLAKHPDAYLYGTLLQAAPFLRDPEAARTWSELYTVALDGIRKAYPTKVGALRTDAALMIARVYPWEPMQ